jgi:hyperosmotically inducible periplasmic protein
MKGKRVSVLTVALAVAMGLGALGTGCASRNNPSVKDNVKKSLEQADLKDVTVSEDRDKNLVTLGGTVHSADAKQRAAEVAQASAGGRVVANEVSIRPVDQEGAAKQISSNVDSGIENNYKAALIANGLDKQHIRFDSKNAVLTLKGSVKNAQLKQQAQQVAQSVPNVQQVINELKVNR